MPRILIVEDNEDLNALITEFFRDEGYTVYSALTGEEGVALSEANKIDLALLDIRLPGMDGWSLAEQVRALHADAPVIYASGNAERQELLPRSEFIQKPYRPEHIFQVAAGLGVDVPEARID